MKYYTQIPTSVADKIVLGGAMTAGLTKDAAALLIKQINAAQMEASTEALITADQAFNAARSAQEAIYNDFHDADEALEGWLGKCTATLGASFGKRWDRQWVQAGFITPSIAIPDIIIERLGLALRLINFFRTNPGYEAPNQDVTAAIGATLRQTAIDTQQLVKDSEQLLVNKGTARDAAVAGLVSDMSLLIGLLREVLNPDDPRWLDFGLQMPAKTATPGAPTGLAVAMAPAHLVAAGADPNTALVLLTCNPEPYATRYRFRMRNGTLLGSKFEMMASTKAPLAQTAIPRGAAMEFIAQAVNGKRQSVASDVVVFTAPAADTARTETVAPLAATVPELGKNGNSKTNGNGNSNGNGNGNRPVASRLS